MGKLCFDCRVLTQRLICVVWESTCGIFAHKTKGFVVGDANYIPTKNNSLLHWPFIKHSHAKKSCVKSLVMNFCSTEDHAEAIHEVHSACPHYLAKLVAMPALCTLLGAPAPASDASASSSYASRLSGLHSGGQQLDMDDGAFESKVDITLSAPVAALKLEEISYLSQDSVDADTANKDNTAWWCQMKPPVLICLSLGTLMVKLFKPFLHSGQLRCRYQRLMGLWMQILLMSLGLSLMSCFATPF